MSARAAWTLALTRLASWARPTPPQLALSLVSWFNFYNGPRTLANNVEAVLTTAALCYWPEPGTVDRSEPATALGPALARSA